MANPCTLEVEQSTQLGGLDYTANVVGLNAMLDGSLSPLWNVGETATDYIYGTFTFTQSFPLAPGTHTVESVGVSLYGVYLRAYHANYRVHTP
ncbi:MAG: hypothetical protein ACLQVM_09725 [Terriglobia bacterium]